MTWDRPLISASAGLRKLGHAQVQVSKSKWPNQMRFYLGRQQFLEWQQRPASLLPKRQHAELPSLQMDKDNRCHVSQRDSHLNGVQLLHACDLSAGKLAKWCCLETSEEWKAYLGTSNRRLPLTPVHPSALPHSNVQSRKRNSERWRGAEKFHDKCRQDANLVSYKTIVWVTAVQR